jgi:hypothetical protein
MNKKYNVLITGASYGSLDHTVALVDSWLDKNRRKAA